MESLIWKVQTEIIGSLEPFKSERDMESFLMNNPAIIGCYIQNTGFTTPTLFGQQLQTKKGNLKQGKIDLAGLSKTEGGYELRIYELKKGKIDTAAVGQIIEYLQGWNNENEAKNIIKSRLLELRFKDINENTVDAIVSRPVGVLVGSKFDAEAVINAKGFKEYKIYGMRLARFKGEAGKMDYYVIVEDQIGDALTSTKRVLGWGDYIKRRLINPTDIFTIKPKDGPEIFARPDPESFKSKSKKLIFEDNSRELILAQWPLRKAEIDALKNRWHLKWVDKAFENVEKGKSNLISHATGIVSFAFGDPTINWQVPGNHWIHKKTRKLLDALKYEFYGLDD